jgi:hypothetical protein
MAVEEVWNTDTITVNESLINIVDIPKTGLHEAWLFFNGLVTGDSFDVYLEVYNKFTAQLNLYKFRAITYINLSNGTEKAVHFNPVFTSHYRIKIQKSVGGLNNRNIDYYALRYF